jgi:hypothetical protein
MDLWSGAGGGLIVLALGGGAALFWRPIAAKRQRKIDASRAMLRSLNEYREVVANPLANAPRNAEVRSRLDADMAEWYTALLMPDEGGVKEFVTRVKEKLDQSSLEWSDPFQFRNSVHEPVLAWSERNRDWPDQYFEGLLTMGIHDRFVPVDQPPASVARNALRQHKGTIGDRSRHSWWTRLLAGR